MMRSRVLFALVILAAPSGAVVAQAATTSKPKMSSDARAAAQARLEREAEAATAQTLDASKITLRDAVKAMRDTLDAASATAALITRAQSTGSVGVERSQARRLRVACTASQLRSGQTLTEIASLNTDNEKGIKLLADYRAALAEVGKLSGQCASGLTVQTGSPSSAAITSAVQLVNKAAITHFKAMDALIRGMEIVLPR